MKHAWPTEALEFYDSVAGTLERLDGIELARECEADPDLRKSRLEPALADLGIFELDPQLNAVDAAVASLGVRAAGSFLSAWPLAAQLSVPIEVRDRVGALYAVAGDPGRLEHLDAVAQAAAIDVDTRAVRVATASGALDRLPLDPFGVPCALGEPIELPDPDRSLGASVILTAYWMLGSFDRITKQVAAYAAERHQFGKPIASFGAIQWRLSDLAVAQAGLDELAGYTLLRFGGSRATRADVLALRLNTIDAAKRILVHAHQVLGAIGLCEEHDVTLVDRHLQASIRRPGGSLWTSSLLAAAIAESGFDAVHPIGAREAVG